METGRVFNVRTGQIVGQCVWRADTFWTRLRGLLGHQDLPAGAGLWLVPCQQVHMFGMHFPLSIWFLDRDNRVCQIIDELYPNQISQRNKKAATVLEFSAGWGQKTNTQIGDCIIWENRL